MAVNHVATPAMNHGYEEAPRDDSEDRLETSTGGGDGAEEDADGIGLNISSTDLREVVMPSRKVMEARNLVLLLPL